MINIHLEQVVNVVITMLVFWFITKRVYPYTVQRLLWERAMIYSRSWKHLADPNGENQKRLRIRATSDPQAFTQAQATLELFIALLVLTNTIRLTIRCTPNILWVAFLIVLNLACALFLSEKAIFTKLNQQEIEKVGEFLNLHNQTDEETHLKQECNP